MNEHLQLFYRCFWLTIAILIGCNCSSAEEVNTTNFAKLKFVADQGNALAQLKLATLYYQGNGVPKNSIEAAEYFQHATYAGLPDAQYLLGLCYKNGDGVSKDTSEAVKWFRAAAEQGFAEAQYMLGLTYECGPVGLQDFKEAVEWYRKAASQGYC